MATATAALKSRPAQAATATSIHFATASGTAQPAEHFNQTAGTLPFAPGQTSQTVPIDIVNHHDDDSDKQFTVQLTGAARSLVWVAQSTAQRDFLHQQVDGNQQAYRNRPAVDHGCRQRPRLGFGHHRIQLLVR